MSKLFTPVTFGPLTLRNRTIAQRHLKVCVRVMPLRKCCLTIIVQLRLVVLE